MGERLAADGPSEQVGGFRQRACGVVLLALVFLFSGGEILASQEEDEGWSEAKAATHPSSSDEPESAEPSTPPSTPGPGMRGVPAREQFLQHALGTQGDVRVPAALLSFAALLAAVVVAWRRVRRGRSSDRDDEEDLPEIEGRDDLEPEDLDAPDAYDSRGSLARAEDPDRDP